MTINKKFVIGAAALTITAAAGTATALAATPAASNSSTYPPIVQKLADTFHLNPADVNKVFQDQKQMNQQQRQQKLNDYLETQVKAGKITEDQKNKMITKLEDLHSQLKNDTKGQRHQDMQNLRSQLEQWAKDNGINNIEDLLPPHAHRGDMHPAMEQG